MVIRMKKGYLYTLEVLIACSILFITFVYIFRLPPTEPELEISIIKQFGFEALQYLDGKGDLRGLIADGNESVIESQLRGILLGNIHFETEICKTTCDQRNVPVNETIVAMNYYTSGYKGIYEPQKLRLWMWRKY